MGTERTNGPRTTATPSPPPPPPPATPPPTAPARPGSGRSTAADTRRRGSGDRGRDVRYEGAGIAAGFIALLVAAAVVVLIVAQNTESVPFEFLWWDADISLAALLLATAFLVLVVDAIVGVVWRRRRRHVRELSAGDTAKR